MVLGSSIENFKVQLFPNLKAQFVWETGPSFLPPSTFSYKSPPLSILFEINLLAFETQVRKLSVNLCEGDVLCGSTSALLGGRVLPLGTPPCWVICNPAPLVSGDSGFVPDSPPGLHPVFHTCAGGLCRRDVIATCPRCFHSRPPGDPSHCLIERL